MTSEAAVAIALGANLGDRAGALARAAAALSSSMTIDAVSTVYDTPPFGRADQPRYLNAALIGRCRLYPHALLAAAQTIERRLGRRRDGPRWGPRRIDIDLVLFGEWRIDHPTLTLPHPQYRERLFVLDPLAEIAPHWRDPRDGARIAALRDRLIEPWSECRGPRRNE